MYIPDDEWDKFINESSDLIDACSYLVFPKEEDMNPLVLQRKNILSACAGMLQAFVNLQDKAFGQIQWNPIENPPKECGTYLVIYQKRHGKSGCFMRVSSYFVGSGHKKPHFSSHEYYRAKDITHWTELPLPPGIRKTKIKSISRTKCA